MSTYWVKVWVFVKKAFCKKERVSFFLSMAISLIPFIAFADSSYKSTLDIRQSLFNQQNFEEQNYQYTDINFENKMKRKSGSYRYEHDLGLLYQRDSELDAFSPKVAELYFGIRRKNYSFYLGRQIRSWNRADDEWKLGLTQPLFNQDYLQPESHGLTGLHFTLHESGFFFKGHLSYINLPHQGPSFELEGEQFRSLNPWFALPPTQTLEQGTVTNVGYRINKPDVQDVIFRGSGAVKVGFASKKGWLSLGYANKISHSFHNAYRFSEETELDQIFVNIDVGLKRQQLYTFDLGKTWNDTTLWLSYIKDKPEKGYTHPSQWVETSLTEQDWISGGVSFRHFLVNDFDLSFSYIKRQDKEDSKETLVKYSDLDKLFTRTYFERSESLQIKAKYKYRLRRREHLSFHSRYEHSVADQGEVTAAKINYSRNQYRFFVEGGVISASQDNEESFFSQYRGNDFVRLGGSYAF